MIATEVASPFLTPMKLAFVAAIFISMPFILYQFWAFVAPGLYKHERKMVLPLVVSSTVLFYLGMAFAYFVVFPLVFGFLTSTAPDGVAVMTDIGRYLDFVLTLFFAFGLAFEVPIATIILVWTGVTTPESLAAKRPYIIVAAFVTGMFLTPPDVISQTLLALPMWVLFEMGIIFSRGFVRTREAGEDETEEEGTPAAGEGHSAAANAGSTHGGAADAVPGTNATYPPDFEPLSEDEMEAELARIEAQENLVEADSREQARDKLGKNGPGKSDDSRLRRAMDLRYRGEIEAARTLLYELMVDGRPEEIAAARALLKELDSA